MGNCQAIDAAVLVIQHADGRLERMFRTVPASEVMRANPGHYVSLIIPLTKEGKEQRQGTTDKREVRFTRVKLLRPNETLDLGHAYRLVTSQEVMKVLRAKKYGGKTMKQREQTDDKENNNNNNEGMKQQREAQTLSGSGSGSGSRPKSWRPNLQSIAEVSSSPRSS